MEIVQGSEEWHRCRIGKITASKINDVMAKLKGKGEASSRKDYRVQLAVERLTGEKTDSFTNNAMMWGTENEPFARQAFEFARDITVDQVGFIDHPVIPMTGCSPDGLIGDDGMVEIKCPKTATHIEWMLAGKIPAQHVNQMLWQMECCGRQWCEFVSYDPRLPVELQLFIPPRLDFTTEAIAPIRAEVIRLLAEVDQLVQQLKDSSS
jgi:putative phage-type endonuclease